MLLSFSVTNFRSIHETQTLSMTGTSLGGPRPPMDVEYPGDGVGVLPCALIYGANASGKSNMLSAFTRLKSLIAHSHSGLEKTGRLGYSPFLLSEEASAAPTTFEVSFIASGIRYDYGLSYTEDEIEEEWLYSYPEGRRRKLFEREGISISFGQGMRGAKKVLSSFVGKTSLFLSVAAQNNHEELSVVSSFFLRTFAFNQISVASELLNRSLSDGEVDPRAIAFLEYVGSGVCDFTVETSEMSAEQKKVLGELFRVIANARGGEGDSPELKLDEKEFEVKLGHRSSKGEIVYFKGALESAGTRRLLLLMNYIFQVLDSGDIAVIDEIDASLHTFAVEAIFALFCDERVNKSNAQLIATTHDTNLLDLEAMRRDEIWFVEKDRSGASEYFSLAELNVRRGEAAEKAYLDGRYGATPSRVPSELFVRSELPGSEGNEGRA